MPSSDGIATDNIGVLSPWPDLPSSAVWGRTAATGDAAPINTTSCLPSITSSSSTIIPTDASSPATHHPGSANSSPTSAPSRSSSRPSKKRIIKPPSSKKLQAELFELLYTIEQFRADKLAAQLAAKSTPSAKQDSSKLTGTNPTVAPSKKSRRRRRHRRGRPPRLGGRTNIITSSPSTLTHISPSSVLSNYDAPKNQQFFVPSSKRKRRRRRYRTRYRKASSDAEVSNMCQGPQPQSICRGRNDFQLPLQDGRAAKANRARFFDSPPSRSDISMMQSLDIPIPTQQFSTSTGPSESSNVGLWGGTIPSEL